MDRDEILLLELEEDMIDNYDCCTKCFYVYSNSELSEDMKLCTNCGAGFLNFDNPSKFPSMDVIMYYDMMKYFHIHSVKRKKEQKKEAISEISNILSKQVDWGEIEALIEEMKKNRIEKDRHTKPDYLDMNVEFDIYQTDLHLIREKFFTNEKLLLKIYVAINEIQRTFNENKAVVLASCSMMEVLFNELNILLLLIRGTNPEHAENIIDKDRSFDRKEKRFWEETGCKFKNALDTEEFREFYQEWEWLRNIRNKFAHGDHFSIDQENAEKAYELCKKTVDVYVALQNKYVARKPIENSTV